MVLRVTSTAAIAALLLTPSALMAAPAAAPACAASPARHKAAAMDNATAKANAALFRRYGEIWATGRLDLLHQVIGAGYIGHTSSGDRDAAGLEDRIRKFRELYADLGFTVLDQFAEGDRVATRMRITGVVRATHKPVTLIGLNISRFSKGRIVEEWPVWEQLGAESK